MNIVFFWDKSINEKNAGVPLGGKYDISYSFDKKVLTVKNTKEYCNIWGEGSVKDLVAIVGENGSGKTKLLNVLMEDLSILRSNDRNGREPFIIAIDSGSQLDLYLYKVECHIAAEEGITCKKADQYNLYNKFEVAYFNNQFTVNDYYSRSRCQFDFSLGYEMYLCNKNSREMNHEGSQKDIIVNYTNRENYNIIRYLYLNYEASINCDKELYPVPIPKVIRITVDRSEHNFAYIFDEIEKELRIRKDGQTDQSVYEIEDLNNLEEIKKCLSGLNSITEWEDKIYYELILVLIRRLCIDQYVGDYKHAQIRDVLKIGRNICAKLTINTLQENLNSFISALNSCHGIHEGDKFGEIEPVKAFTEWMEQNQLFIKENKKNEVLNVIVSEKTKEFMIGMLNTYNEIRLARPFLVFSFGISSGEYSYLQLFSNLFQIAEKNDDFTYMNPKNLILLFDEAELTMHPRWQVKYCSWLKDYCNRIFDESDIKIILTTHSPVLLSDFPSSNVTYIKNDDSERKYYRDTSIKPFGCDITTLYSDSFFLDVDGTIGKLAKEYINGLARDIPMKKYEKEEAEERVKIIGERIFRHKLKELIMEYYD